MRTFAISRQLDLFKTWEDSQISSPAARPAKTPAPPTSAVRASKASKLDCSLKPCGWCEKCDPRGFALRTALACELEALTGFSMDWKRRATPRGRSLVGADNLRAPHRRKRMWLIAADADRDRVRLEPGRPGGANWEGAPVAPHHPDTNPHAGRLCPSGAEANGRGASGQCEAEIGNPDRSGLEIGESLGSDARAQLAALERAVGPAAHTWNGGAARHLGMAHELAPRLVDIRVPDFKHPGATISAAKACIAAQGDAILPQIAEAIGRAIMSQHVLNFA